jgi:hypothetical protein
MQMDIHIQFRKKIKRVRHRTFRHNLKEPESEAPDSVTYQNRIHRTFPALSRLTHREQGVA